MINFSTGDSVLKEAGPVFGPVLEFTGLAGRTFQATGIMSEEAGFQHFRCDLIQAAPVDQCIERMKTETSKGQCAALK